jgi:hypothetical protein
MPSQPPTPPARAVDRGSDPAFGELPGLGRVLPGQAEVGHCAKGVDIGGRSTRAMEITHGLGRRVMPAVHAAGVVGRVSATQRADIDEHQPAVRVDHAVGRLHVPVNHRVARRALRSTASGSTGPRKWGLSCGNACQAAWWSCH